MSAPSPRASAAPSGLPAPRRAVVVGILNLTPDSFYDGGRHAQHDRALAAAEEMIAQGADWIDVGGESTRPGAAPVDAEEECRRVLPVIRALAGRVTLSIDTTKATVAARAHRGAACMVRRRVAASIRAMAAPSAALAASASPRNLT